MPPLRVIAAAVVSHGRLLLVSKLAAPATYYLPGGKPEAGESPEACLRRELCEELGVAPRHLRHFADIHARAALEPREMHMTVFRADIEGRPRPAGEISSICWWPAEQPVLLAPAVRDHVIPRLRAAQALT